MSLYLIIEIFIYLKCFVNYKMGIFSTYCSECGIEMSNGYKYLKYDINLIQHHPRIFCKKCRTKYKRSKLKND